MHVGYSEPESERTTVTKAIRDARRSEEQLSDP